MVGQQFEMNHPTFSQFENNANTLEQQDTHYSQGI